MKSKLNHENVSRLQSLLLSFLKKKAVKVAVKKLAMSGWFAGIWGVIVSFAVRELFDEVVEPLMKAASAELGYLYHKKEGKVLIKKLEQAEESGNEQDYNDTIDDILN